MFCQDELNKIIIEAQKMFEQTQELLALFNKTGNQSVKSGLQFLDRVIMIYSEHNNKIVPSYISKCKNWHDLNLSNSQKEQVKVVEKCLNDILNNNKLVLKLAHQCKANAPNENNFNYIH